MTKNPNKYSLNPNKSSQLCKKTPLGVPPLYSATKGVENEAVEQIAFADRIILNKTDLVEESELQEVQKAVEGINKNAEIIKAKHSKVDP